MIYIVDEGRKVYEDNADSMDPVVFYEESGEFDDNSDDEDNPLCRLTWRHGARKEHTLGYSWNECADALVEKINLAAGVEACCRLASKSELDDLMAQINEDCAPMRW